MINTMKKVLIKFVDKRHKIVFFDKDEIILKQTQVKRHNKDITENVSKTKIRRNIITLELVQLTNAYRERKHIEEKKSIIMRNEIILKSVQIVQNGNSEINTEETNIMTVCDNISIFESRKNRNDQYETSTEEEVKISKACKNESYWLLNMIVRILHINIKELIILRWEYLHQNTRKETCKSRITCKASERIR